MNWIFFALGIGALIGILSYFGQKECPHCRKRIDRRATACPHCQRDLPAEAGASTPSADRWTQRFDTAPDEEERPKSSFERENRKSTAWIPYGILLVLIIALVVACTEKEDGSNRASNSSTRSRYPSPTATAQPVISYDIVRRWEMPCRGKGGIGMEMLVSPNATREQVMQLAGKLRAEFSNKGCIQIAIYDSREAWMDRLDALKPEAKLRLSEEEYFRHYLVDISRNANTGHDETIWVAKGRGH